jgi:cytochrome c553
MTSRIAAAAVALASGFAAAQQPPAPAQPAAAAPQPPAPAFAVPYLDRLAVRALAANCAACHGPDGRPAPDSVVPGLAGMTQGEMARKLEAIRSGTQPTTVMQQLVKGYTPAELQAIAQYYAQLGAKP